MGYQWSGQPWDPFFAPVPCVLKSWQMTNNHQKKNNEGRYTPRYFFIINRYFLSDNR